jgi:hypothetical protein
MWLQLASFVGRALKALFQSAPTWLVLDWTVDVVPRKGAHKPSTETVRDFGLQTFGSHVVRSGAKFVTLTPPHGKMFFPAPLRSLEKFCPDA